VISFDLSDADVELYEAARRMLLTAHHSENHRVAAAMRGESGAIYLGLHIGSKRLNVCAESSALANARMAQEASIQSVVAVSMDGLGEPQVTNPCGLCRELLRTYGTGTTVLVDAEGEVGKIRIKDLLPLPWMRAAETEWDTRPPRTQETAG
jgi:cytidine deaminase